MLSIEENIHNLKIVDSSDKELNEEDKVLFLNFIDSFIPKESKTIVYRGTKYFPVMPNATPDSKIEELSESLFVLGEKGQYFLQECIKKEFEKVTDNVFLSIWERFHNMVLMRKQSQSSISLKHIQTFIKNNPDFVKFFANEDNESIFLQKVHKCSDKDKILIKDYYLGLVHTKGGKNDTYFISSSTNYNIAKDFAHKRGIIIYSWVPLDNHNLPKISLEGLGNHKELIKELSLPIYDEPLYSEQEELSLKCGILPHYIIGYQYRDRFIVNPALLEVIKKDYSIDEIIQEGLEVDQTHFFEYMQKQGYKRYFIAIDGVYYMSFDV